MKIIHNIALNVDKQTQALLSSWGISVKEGFDSFKVSESDECWPQVEQLAIDLNAIDTVTTTFTAKELLSAASLRMVSDWHHGYPEPSGNSGYLSEVYDLAEHCQTCGVGLVQLNPFKMSKEPKWGSRGILQLNWVFDEFFVKPNVWEDIFKPFGIESREVLHAKTNRPLLDVVQLVIPDISTTLQLTGDHAFETCSSCNRNKYVPISRGKFPPLVTPTDLPIFRANAYFGSGATAHKPIVVSQPLYLAIKQGGLKGASFIPLEEKDS